MIDDASGKFEQAMEASTTVLVEASAPSEQTLRERSIYIIWKEEKTRFRGHL